MALWWFITSNARCSYEELKRRRCLALGWRDIGSLQHYIKDDPRWERQFKTRLQLKGNLAYSKDKSWIDHGATVPDLFWQLINIQPGDFIVLLEAGSQLTLGKTEVFGIAQAPHRAIEHYHYDERYDHAHQIYTDLEWIDWQRARFGELEMPRVSFKSMLRDDSQLPSVQAAWRKQTAAAQ